MITIKFTIKLNCTVKLYSEYGVDSEKSVSQLVSAVTVFKGIYCHLKNKWLQKILFDVNFLEIHHNGVAFVLASVDDN